MSRGVFNLSLAIRLGSRPSSSSSGQGLLIRLLWTRDISRKLQKLMSERAIYKHNWPPLCEHHSQTSLLSSGRLKPLR